MTLLKATPFLMTLILAGCGGDGDGPRQSPSSATTPTNTQGDVPQAPCSANVNINGGTVTVTGSPGATVQAGNVTIIFNFDCSSTVALPVAQAGSRVLNGGTHRID